MLDPYLPLGAAVAAEADEADTLAKVGIAVGVVGIILALARQPQTIVQQVPAAAGTVNTGMASATVADIVDITGIPGVANTYSRGDHQHAHGLRGAVNGIGAPLHPLATQTVPGFLPTADKVLIDTILAIPPFNGPVTVGTGAMQTFAHGMGVVPRLAETELLALPATAGLAFTIITAVASDATNVYVTAGLGVTYAPFAIA